MADFNLDFVGPGARLALAAALRAEAAAGSSQFAVSFLLWTDLAAVASAMEVGVRAQVAISDTGTHTDPVAGAGTLNAGIYVKQAGYALPVRIADLDSQASENYRDQALAAADDIADRIAPGTRVGDFNPTSGVEPTHAWGDSSGNATLSLMPDGTLVNKHIEQIEERAGRDLAGATEPTHAWGDDDGNAILELYPDGSINNVQINALQATVDFLSAGGGSSKARVGVTDTSHLAVAWMQHRAPYGQSLSIGIMTPSGQIISVSAKTYAKMFFGGVRTADGASNYTTHRASLVNLVERVNGLGGETIASGMATTLRALRETEDGIILDGATTDVPFYSAAGEGGKSASELSDGTTYFTRFKDDATAAKARADESFDGSYQMVSMPYIQAEQDYTYNTPAATWKTLVRAIRTAAEAHAQTVSGLSRPLPMILYQCAQHASKSLPPTLAEAGLEMALSDASMGIACPMYMFDYVDAAHLTAESYFWLGCYMGWFDKRWVHDGIKVSPLSPVEEVWDAHGVSLRFEPEGRLVFDTAQVVDPGDYGFELLNDDSSVKYDITARIVGADWVRLQTSSTISAHARWQYAWSTNTPVQAANFSGRQYGARGCLRDTLGDRIQITSPTGTIHRLDRWAFIDHGVRP